MTLENKTLMVLRVNISKLRHHLKTFYGLLGFDNIWQRCTSLTLWNLRLQKNQNIEKIDFKVVNMGHCSSPPSTYKNNGFIY